MKFYLNVTMKCEDCGYEVVIQLGKDRYVRHDCNYGDEETKVPPLDELMGIRRKS